MTKEEFTSRTGSDISDKDYEMIEYVYARHPSIDPVKGKDQVAMLFVTFGMRIFVDMKPTAEKAEALRNKILSLQAQLSDVKEKYKELEAGTQ